MSNQVPPQRDRRIEKMLTIMRQLSAQNKYLGLKIEEHENQIEYLNACQGCHCWLIIYLITGLITLILYLIFH